MKRAIAYGAALSLALFVSAVDLCAADSNTQVHLDTSKSGPRAVESVTEQRILRDYRFAWASLAQALEFNTLDPLEGPFVGAAKKWLGQSVSSQRRTTLSSRFLEQNHKLDAVFYAPEGDVIELHDTAEYRIQILDGGKQIHDERMVVHYVVLMTPGADRWVIRQLQAVAQF
jgi:hypothetical protein